jgi:hypothetical protein
MEHDPSGDPPDQGLSFWGQIGLGFAVTGLGALVTNTAPNVGAKLICGIVGFGGLLVVFAPFAGFRLPGPRAKHHILYRIAFLVMGIAIFGPIFLQSAVGKTVASRVGAVVGIRPGTPTPVATHQPTRKKSIPVYTAFQKCCQDINLNDVVGSPVAAATTPQRGTYEAAYQNALAIWIGGDDPKWILLYPDSETWESHSDRLQSKPESAKYVTAEFQSLPRLAVSSAKLRIPTLWTRDRFPKGQACSGILDR